MSVIDFFTAAASLRPSKTTAKSTLFQLKKLSNDLEDLAQALGKLEKVAGEFSSMGNTLMQKNDQTRKLCAATCDALNSNDIAQMQYVKDELERSMK